MLRLLADENIPKRLVTLLRKEGIEVIRLQDLGLRGISDRAVVDAANRLGYVILTRDSDYLTYVRGTRYGVVYVAYQPTKTELPELAQRIAGTAGTIDPKPGMLIMITRYALEIYG